ncbi:DUF2027 domain-containing protein [Carboxylicivirga caseinilyticus]|uniref:DUF2027 domain-containing protein n=1 Tax=Carboxylicivirga caseinilyticus TaxID=3417572 RepID=UPI003D342F22|nr:DUF2027 domain-containing protein [Marinilabiliaceae bacterium A049]
MKVKAGDIVRFLNISGGGTVTRVEGKLAFVEDEDGFEIPVMTHEVVVIEDEKPTVSNASTGAVDEAEEESYEYIEEEGNDDNPKFFVAFLPGEKQGVESGHLRVQLINDSNYFSYYTISKVNKDATLELMFNGLIEPNTKIGLDKMTVLQLDDRQWKVNIMMFKKGRAYKELPSVSTDIKIKAARFFKENSFADNDYYHEKAVLMSIIKGEFEMKLEQLSQKEVDQVVKEKEAKPARKKFARRDEPGILEVDLHIDELIDTTAGLSKGEILNIQVDKFKQVMKENEKFKGKKLVFIHGVGAGTLKNEIRRLLERQYKKHTYQDASFREYGFGATMVII